MLKLQQLVILLIPGGQLMKSNDKDNVYFIHSITFFKNCLRCAAILLRTEIKG